MLDFENPSYFRPTSNVKSAMIRIQLRSIIACALLAGALAALPARWVPAQTAPAAVQGAPDNAMQISWEVRNRFRLFREERDFLLHAENAQGRTILPSDQALELHSDGPAWPRTIVSRLCTDLASAISTPP